MGKADADEDAASDVSGDPPVDGSEKGAKRPAVGSIEAYEHEMAAASDRRAKRTAAAKVVKGRPAAAVKPKAKAKYSYWPKGSRPPLPKTGDAGIDYGPSRILVSESKKAYRIIMERGNFNSEKRKKWAGGKPTLAVWAEALKLVDSVKTKK